jgi:Rap1a immunity proteins
MLAFRLAVLQQGTSEVSMLDRGSALYQSCQALVKTMDSPEATQDYRAAASCSSYIDGFTDGLDFRSRNSVCVTGATLGTMSRIYVAYMQKNPKLLDLYKSVGLYMALLDSYPCATKK